MIASSGGPGPEFSSSFLDWANKINHLGQRKWTDPESGMSYYINDAGEITGVYPITGMAPTPGKGYSKGMYNAFLKQFQQHGLKSILKSQAKIQSRLNSHLQAIDDYTKAGGYTSSDKEK